MGRPKIDMAGRRYGKLVVIEQSGVNSFGHPLWLCKCDCGNTRKIVGSDLRARSHKSCGCSQMTQNGLHLHPLYQTWRGMLKRCYNPKACGFTNYGGRGIRVCDRWHILQNFIDDMYATWKPGLEIDRMDNNGNYCPENCQWTTPYLQSRNMRRNRLVTYNGRTQCVTDWAKEFGLHKSTLARRLDRGLPIEKALMAQTKTHNQTRKVRK